MKMLKQTLGSRQLLPRLAQLLPRRSLAQQEPKAVVSSEPKQTDELAEKNEQGKFDVQTLPKSAKDNFLIEFKKRKPSYDQIFEYQIDEKPHEKFSRPKVKSLISADMKIFLNRKYDFSWASIKRVIERAIHKNETESQKYLTQRHGILGPDLATSHFIINRGGKVRFLHKPDVWIGDLKCLPSVYDKTYRLISVDASDTHLMYDGLDNFILLNQLEELNLSNNRKLDDFACDKIARLFRNSTTLTYLDLSNIPNITHRGVEALYKIRSLQTLVIQGTRAAEYPFIELLVLMYQDVNPHCNIIYK